MNIFSNFIIHQGDTFKILPNLSEQVDMIFADPPYFISGGSMTMRSGKIIPTYFGEWDKIRTVEEKDDFNLKWITSCKNLLKPNGTIWVSGTLHNIYSVERCLVNLGFKILNIITWQKIDPIPSFTENRFNFSAEFIIWAAKSSKSKYIMNFDLMKQLNGGKQMSDVWQIPSVGSWEKTAGKHPTQKPLRLLYRIILASTKEGDTILDPFAGSGTTGIAANLLNRNFIGIEQDQSFVDICNRRRQEIEDPVFADKLRMKMAENPNEVTVLVNHAKPDTISLMIEKGICYLRAGESKGSLQVTPGFERMQYVCLHTAGDNIHIYKLKRPGTFQIWTKENLEQHGFHPSHADYYLVLHFDNSKELQFKRHPQIKQRINTYRSKIRPLSDFIGIK